ncbi:MAG: hypothetical protein ABJC74_05230 [Gemmatimonadota bacterium]
MSLLYTAGPLLLPLGLVLTAALVAAHLPLQDGGWIERLGGGRWAPWIAGAVTTLVCAVIWGSPAPVAIIHDEAAYLLQARLLAAGHLVGPGRTLPEFFEQFHVFVTPVLAAKYPLGFGLALVPGIWLGWPALMPLLFNGLAGGLLFALVRRLSAPGCGALAWLLWLLAPGTITYHTAYLSETLSGPLWLLAWWALLEWRLTGERRWLVGLSVAVAACALTRPLTAVALAIPTGLVVLMGVYRRQRWLDLLAAGAAGLVVISPLFYQNYRVTGDWRVTPWERYADIYAPVDRPGFTIDSAPPQRALPKDMRDYIVTFTEPHVGFVPRNLPGIFVERSHQVLHDAWGEWLLPLALFAVLGLMASGRELWFGMASALSLVLVHLVFAHPLNWSLYYQEGQPPLAAVTATGLAVVAGSLANRMGRRGASPAITPRGTLAVWLMVGCAVATGVPIVRAAREREVHVSAYHQAFHDLISGLPGPSIVFVRYSRVHPFWNSLIDNPPDLDRAPTWLVHDRGTENHRLIELAPRRTPYLYVEQRKELIQLNPDGSPASGQ